MKMKYATVRTIATILIGLRKGMPKCHDQKAFPSTNTSKQLSIISYIDLMTPKPNLSLILLLLNKLTLSSKYWMMNEMRTMKIPIGRMYEKKHAKYNHWM